MFLYRYVPDDDVAAVVSRQDEVGVGHAPSNGVYFRTLKI